MAVLVATDRYRLDMMPVEVVDGHGQELVTCAEAKMLVSVLRKIKSDLVRVGCTGSVVTIEGGQLRFTLDASGMAGAPATLMHLFLPGFASVLLDRAQLEVAARFARDLRKSDATVRERYGHTAAVLRLSLDKGAGTRACLHAYYDRAEQECGPGMDVDMRECVALEVTAGFDREMGELLVAVNPDHLLDVCTSAPFPVLRFHLVSGTAKPVAITGPDDHLDVPVTGYRHLLMAMRLKWREQSSPGARHGGWEGLRGPFISWGPRGRSAWGAGAQLRFWCRA